MASRGFPVGELYQYVHLEESRNIGPRVDEIWECYMLS